MASPGRAMPFVLSVLLALASAVAGFAIAHVEREPAPGNQVNEAVLAEVRALAEQIARLDARLTANNVATPAPAAQREPAARATEPGPHGEPIDDERLAKLLHAALATLSRGDDDVLRQARLQNPQPNVAAVTDLHTRLAAARGREENTHQREWWLLGMADVVQRLGMPDELIQTKDGQLWEYHLSDNRVLSVHFQNGAVVMIHD